MPPPAPRDPPIVNPPIRLGVCVSGGGTTLQNLIDRIDSGALCASIVSVVASRPGIGAIDRARRAGLSVTVARADRGNAPAMTQAVFDPITNAGADLVILAGFLSMIEVPQEYALKVMNIHPSLVPAFSGKGFYGERVHAAALERGVKISGCTVHFVDGSYDTGPIILQTPVPVWEGDTPASLAARVFEAECEALPQAISLYAAGRLEVKGGKVHLKPPASSAARGAGPGESAVEGKS